MKKNKLKIAIMIIIGSLAILSILPLTNKSNFEMGKKDLEMRGYTNIERTGHRYFCCNTSNMFSDGFKALDSNGDEITGCICSRAVGGIDIIIK